MRQTSLMAYDELTSLGARQQEVFQMLARAGPCTDRELCQFMGFFDPNKVRPRRYELFRDGYVREVTKRPCKVSGKVAYVWEVI